VPAGYNGPLSALVPPDGSGRRLTWARFTFFSDRTVPKEERRRHFQEAKLRIYLLLVRPPIFICDWQTDDPT
jgi:hypothetical protein